MVELTGQIEQVTCFDEVSGFTVARHADGRVLVTVTAVGRLLDRRLVGMLAMTGEWAVHPTFGEQFKVREFKLHVPATAQSILKYLGSGMIRGLGPEMASRIVDRFGDRTLEIIEDDIDQLQAVKGIGRQRLASIQKAWEEQKDVRLREFADQGHVFAPLGILAPQAATLLSVDEGLIRAAIDRLNGQKRNNYDKDIFNGDVGRIAALNENGRGLDVRFDGRIVSYDAAEPDEIMNAYAVSVHKAQGSEFPAVVIPVLTQHDVLLQRNLIYTAITRGRRLAVLAGSRRALAMAVARNDQGIRHSGLHQRLRA